MQQYDLSTSGEELTKFLTQRYLESFLRGKFIPASPMADKIAKHYSLPKVASHIVSPRGYYTHHGLYIGNEEVIHYEGLSDGLNSGPIRKVSLDEFCNNKGYKIRYHHGVKLSDEEIVSRAKSRLNESSYNLVFNNCEHFVNWCIHGVDRSDQVNNVIKWASSAHPITHVGTAMFDSGKSITAYIEGKISGEKLSHDISGSAISTASATYYAGLGQVAIPVPVAGALIGAGIGLIVGNLLRQSGLIALGEAPAVTEARERREEIEDLCNRLIPSIQESRKQLENQMERYFKNTEETLAIQFDALERSLTTSNPSLYIKSLENIASAMNVNLQFSDFYGFKNFMASNDAFEL